MAYYEDEIKKELKVGETYTSREIASLLAFSDSVVLNDEVSQFSSSSDRKFKVVNVLETFVHRNERSTYQIPYKKNNVYIVQKAIG
jgi:hypothetical protein